MARKRSKFRLHTKIHTLCARAGVRTVRARERAEMGQPMGMKGVGKGLRRESFS